MMTVRNAHERGHSRRGWLDSYHTFSFAEYHDPAHMGFHTLRVINEDRVQPGQGFLTHPHRDMEIITYVLEGALEHKDSLGTGSVIHPGDIQRMSAGTGITHSEFNHSRDEPVHFLQIWILPERMGLPPSYEQRAFSTEEKRRQLRLVASRDGRESSVTIHQDVSVYLALLAASEQVRHPLARGRHAWVQIVRGAALLNGISLLVGDGAAVSGEEFLRLDAREEAEILLFDMA
jgi:redox-sensitive bicupin YhaK (pirin superfamily)